MSQWQYQCSRCHDFIGGGSNKKIGTIINGLITCDQCIKKDGDNKRKPDVTPYVITLMIIVFIIIVMVKVYG